MNDATQLLTTLAQLGGGFVAIIVGFIFSSVLSTERQIRLLRKQYQSSHAQMLQEYRARGITAYDISKGGRKNDVEPLSGPLDEIVDEVTGVQDTYVVRKALLCIIPMVLFGIFVPLILLGTNLTELIGVGMVVLVVGFLFSVLTIVGFIVWYVWSVHTSW